LIDEAHIDQAGFAPTLPTCYSWYPMGERLFIDYEAPQGRRVNVLGAYFSHGPLAGRFEREMKASRPKSEMKKAQECLEEVAKKHGLSPEQVGKLDAEGLVAFLWRIADRPAEAAQKWKREIPLYVVLDNYSVHKSKVVKKAIPVLAAANVHLVYLSSYSPELSEIEPIWLDVKHRRMTRRSYERLGDLFKGIDDALEKKALDLQAARSTVSHQSLPLAA